MNKLHMLAVFLLFLLASCNPYNAQEIKVLNAKRMVFEKLHGNLSVPVFERVQLPTTDFLKELKENDKALGMAKSDAYAAYMPTTNELALFKSYIAMLPHSYQTLFTNKLVVVYFVDNLSGAGLTEWITDSDGNCYYYMVLNSALLKVSLDDWLSDKENSFFANTPSSPIMRVSTGTKYKALMYALLHEGAHALDFEVGVTPYVDELHKKFAGRKIKTSVFTNGVWLQQMKPVARYDFSHRAALNPYGEYSSRGLLAKTDMRTMFAQLSQTPFVGFYSGMSWNEDLADFMTYEILEKKLGGMVSMDFLDQGKLIGQYLPLRTQLTRQRENSVNSFLTD